MNERNPGPTPRQDHPNLSTEHQPAGDARQPQDTLDRQPKRDPRSGATIPDDYNPETMTRVGEEKNTPPVEYARPGEPGEPLA